MNNSFLKEAINHFGITTNPNHLFYILPDGSWLDGSGAHYFDDELEREQHRRYTKYRTVDHGDVNELSFIPYSGSGAMFEFMYLCDAARADARFGILAIMQGNKHYKTIINSFVKANSNRYAAVLIYSKRGYIVAETEFDHVNAVELLNWYKLHMNDKPTNVLATMKKRFVRAEIEKLDTIVLDLPLAMRLFELCKETIKDDIHIHTLTEALLDLRTEKECLTMDDYPAILEIADIQAEEPETQEALDSIDGDE